MGLAAILDYLDAMSARLAQDAHRVDDGVDAREMRTPEVLARHLGQVAAQGLPGPVRGATEVEARRVADRADQLVALRQQRVVLLDVELVGVVHRLRVHHRALGVGLRVLLGDRGDAIDHGRHAGALRHGAVDQPALVHVLQRQRAGALHQRVVLGEQGLDLAGGRLGRPVDRALLRGVALELQVAQRAVAQKTTLSPISGVVANRKVVYQTHDYKNKVIYNGCSS